MPKTDRKRREQRRRRRERLMADPDAVAARERAKEQREAIRRRGARRRMWKRLGRIGLIVALAGGGVGAFLALRGGEENPQAEPLPGLLTTPGPWDANNGADFQARLEKLDLPELGSTFHLHEHIEIFVHGRPFPIPVNIGVSALGTALAPIHTHDDTGIIHVESKVKATFTLGEFFDVWGVRFDQSCLGGNCASGGTGLRVFIDGAEVHGDPRTVELTSHQEIVVTFGTEAELPSPIPKDYSKKISPSCAPSC